MIFGLFYEGKMKEKQTKIVATISDLICDVELLKKMYNAGMDVVRLNTAHQTIESSKKVIKNVRAVSDKIAIMIDTKGPEVRTRKSKEKLFLKDNFTIKLKYGDVKSVCDNEVIYVSYKNFVKDVPNGSTILIDDGQIELKVTKKGKDYFLCKIVEGGLLKNFKGVNVPGKKLNMPALSDKDKKYIDLAIKEDVEFIAHSFVRNSGDIFAIQQILDKNKSDIKILAKIENKEGVDNVDKIISSSYGILVARGDLGIELPAETIPVVQKMLIKKCVKWGKPVITATQMMESMIDNPRPTRAEVSDVANAILDGSDAVMLSGETSYGKYPVKVIDVVEDIAKYVEKTKKPFRRNDKLIWGNKIHKFFGKHAIQACIDLPIKAIVISTRSGATARLVACHRGRVPIYAETFSKRVMRELALVYGVYPACIPKPKNTDDLVSKSVSVLIKDKIIQKKDLVLVIGSTPGQEGIGADFLEIKAAHLCVKKMR